MIGVTPDRKKLGTLKNPYANTNNVNNEKTIMATDAHNLTNM